VGNLPFNTSEETVLSMFSEFGEVVEAKLIIDRMTGRSKGIAFVTYQTEDMATAAIEGLNGKDHDGRPLVVNVARPMVPRDRGSFGGGRDDRDNRGGGNRGYDRRGR
jgi:RNA recognition motif-containing protein